MEENSQKPNFIELEKKLLDWWYKSGIVKKYLSKNKNAKKRFSFLDGPITANNPMGVHHAWGRTLKDLFQRYKNMQGFRQRFQNGFDNQGLWVEVEVEKELGFKSKKDIEKYGIARFVNKCKERTLRFAKIQTEQSKRLGYFMDWENSYYTMSEENNYMIWRFLKKCWQTKWENGRALYKGRDSVPWCPRCGTAISQHEILTEEYKELTHNSVYLKYPALGEDFSFLVWTTTPWTLPGNVALAVHPQLDYCLLQTEDNQKLWLVASLKEKIFGKKGKILKIVKGEKLAGLKYQGPFDDLEAVKAAFEENPKTFHTVVLSKEYVNDQEGTGIVHIAPGCGEEDFQLGKEVDLPVIAVIDEGASYLEGFGDLVGKNAKENPDLILKHPLMEKYIFKIFPYTHRYPVCWRCKTELVWRVVDEWYIAMDPFREKIKAVAKKIRWIPPWGLDMELDWLTNMKDWLISKKRFWGLALPIWECQKCGHFEVVGSKEELKEKAVEGWEEFEGHSPHRPWVDKVKIRCPKCGSLISRIPDVGNPWLDAGIVPFSTLIDPRTKKVSYLTDKKYWREWFPADFVTECYPGQFKNWFYSLLAMSTVLENKPPFKNLLGHALVKDEKGEEMHKSKGNAIAFDEAAEKIGVDVMRWMYCRQNPEVNLNFGYHVANDVRRLFHLKLWNVFNFYVIYQKIDRLPISNCELKSENILDRWIISRLNQLISQVTKSLDNFDSFTAAQKIEEFVEDLSTWYVRRSRDRVGPTASDKNDKKACYQTLWYVLVNLSKVLAPFIPFLSEYIYKNLTSKKSVHLESWPKAGKVEEKLLEEMALVRKICELGHAERKKAGIKVRQPLAKFSIFLPVRQAGNFQFSISNELAKLIEDELNVKKVVFKQGEGELEVKLDTKITPELKEEGETRELIRKIQELRKKAGCALDGKIIVEAPNLPTKPELQEYLKKETLAKELRAGKELKIFPI